MAPDATNRTPLPWRIDPLAALQRWPADRPVVMLHSGRHDPRWARWSILAEPTGAYRFRDRTPDGASTGPDTGRSDWLGPASPPPAADLWTHRPLRDLGTAVADDDALWVGYLAYDLARFIEQLPRHARRDRDWPIIQMQRCPGWLVHDGATDTWFACGTSRDAGPDAHRRPNLPALPPHVHTFTAGNPTSATQRDRYLAMVQRGIDYIAAGDVFQVNLTQRFTAPFHGEPRALYDALARTSPAWYGAYLELLDDHDAATPRRALASTSPELFLELAPGGHVTTRPIKGTRPGHVSPDELRDSEKDAAELHMIVDLLRNDLGRVCSYGTIRVEEARAIESHPTVHHGVATITGTLHPSRTLMHLLRATMPGGSITGAPKVRAMQIIDELEPVRRGPYCGAIGWLHRDTACFNIAIRTLCIERDATGDRGRVDFGVGGGIVADSDPAAEYQESLDKAAAMLTALAAGTPHPQAAG